MHAMLQFKPFKQRIMSKECRKRFMLDYFISVQGLLYFYFILQPRYFSRALEHWSRNAQCKEILVLG
jgi:hypothetical protein